MPKIQVVSVGIPATTAEAPTTPVKAASLASRACLAFRRIGESGFESYVLPALASLPVMTCYNAETSSGFVHGVTPETESQVMAILSMYGELDFDAECN